MTSPLSLDERIMKNSFGTTTSQAVCNQPTGVPRITLAERARGFSVAEEVSHSLAITAMATVPVFFAICFAAVIISNHWSIQ